MTYNEENNAIEHEIIIAIFEKDFIGCDYLINLPIDSKFIKDTFKAKKIGKDEIRQFKITDDSWNSLPLYELKNNKIISFDYTKYAYFGNTDRRVALAFKINELYNVASEAKKLRKTLKKILDHLGIVDDSFEKYNTKIEEIINRNPK